MGHGETWALLRMTRAHSSSKDLAWDKGAVLSAEIRSGMLPCTLLDFQGQVETPKHSFGQRRAPNTSWVALDTSNAPTDALSHRSCFGKATARQVLHFSIGLGSQ